MTPDALRQILIDELGRIAPETDPGGLPTDADIREELDLDSMDFLNLITALHERLHVDIPEVDYPQFYSVDRAIEYLLAKT